jgi:uroporphyrinogen-III synthase
LTSPSSARVFLDLLREGSADIRSVPKLLTCGPGTAGELRKQGFHPEVATSDYGTKGLLQRAGDVLVDSNRVLRFRSEKAPSTITDALKQWTEAVDDVIAYRNESISHDAVPQCDTIFFASGSAVDAFVADHSVEALEGKTILTIGTPTADALQRYGVSPDVVASEATVESAMESLARWRVRKHLDD